MDSCEIPWIPAQLQGVRKVAAAANGTCPLAALTCLLCDMSGSYVYIYIYYNIYVYII